MVPSLYLGFRGKGNSSKLTPEFSHGDQVSGMASIYRTVVRIAQKAIWTVRTIFLPGTRIEEVTMAKIIGFYTPKNFHKPMKWVAAIERGKIIEFCRQTRKSA